jgi:hypothetical protein
MVTCAGVALVSCASKTESRDPTLPSTSTTASAGYDVSRLSQLNGAFPPGFIPAPSEPGTLLPEWVDAVGTIVSYGRPFTVDPPHCRALFNPVVGQVGANTMGIRADGPGKQAIAIGADTPVTVPAEIPVTGCDRMTFDVEDDAVLTRGTAERIAAPNIDGIVTTALKVQLDQLPDVEYHYGAILDERVYVNVAARVAPSFPAQPLLPDLLVKAVAAVRGR